MIRITPLLLLIAMFSIWMPETIGQNMYPGSTSDYYNMDTTNSVAVGRYDSIKWLQPKNSAEYRRWLREDNDSLYPLRVIKRDSLVNVYRTSVNLPLIRVTDTLMTKYISETLNGAIKGGYVPQPDTNAAKGVYFEISFTNDMVGEDSCIGMDVEICSNYTMFGLVKYQIRWIRYAFWVNDILGIVLFDESMRNDVDGYFEKRQSSITIHAYEPELRMIKHNDLSIDNRKVRRETYMSRYEKCEGNWNEIF